MNSALFSLLDSNRLNAVKNIKWTRGQQFYDNITKLASTLCDAPIALISIVGEHAQSFKSKTGVTISETPNDVSFCKHTIENENGMPFIVFDASKDDRFKNNTLVTNNPNIKFYCGFPLINLNGDRLGALCVIDTIPRTLSESQIDGLRTLTDIVREYVE